MTGKKEPKAQPKPYLRGKPLDSGTPRAAAVFFGGLLLMCFLNLILTTTASIMKADWLRIAFCIAQIGVYELLFFYSGQNRGTAGVTLGETMYSRRESGREVDPADEARCFHPLKGFAQALIGSLPALVIAGVYAFLAVPQRMSPGPMPEWVSGITSRPDVTAPLVAYTTVEPAALADWLRVAVRVLLMPFVTIIGTRNSGALLLLERLGPLLVLLPAAAYGVGYCFGPRSRVKVQENIAEGKRRLARRERRERRQRRAAREPEKLN